MPQPFVFQWSAYNTLIPWEKKAVPETEDSLSTTLSSVSG